MNDEAIKGSMSIVGQASTSAENDAEGKAQYKQRPIIHFTPPAGLSQQWNQWLTLRQSELIAAQRRRLWLTRPIGMAL